MSVTRDDRLGTELLGYRIEALLGRGGMGVVYRAFDSRLKRNVALKLVAPELASDERFRERFLSESELAASLEHPGVIPIYEAGEAEGVLYVAMRYVDGLDLKALLRQGPLAPERALAIVSQVAEALDAAHEHGLVHRDVKPSNVLLDRREHAYLADFGLSRRLGEAGRALEAGLSLGTPAYVAPEQILGREVDGRADEYSLACLLYECLTGSPPFARSSEAAVLFAHLEEEPPSHPDLSSVLRRALAKDPGDRYPTCGALVEDARRALGIAEPRRPRWPYALVAVGAAVLGAAVLTAVLGRGGSTAVPLARGSALAAIDARTGTLAATIPVSGRPQGITSGSGSLWVANVDDGTVMRVDPARRAVTRTLPVAGTPTGIGATRDAVWVVSSTPTGGSLRVSRIDPRFDALASTGRVANVVAGQAGLAAAHGNAVWVAPFTGLLSRLDARTGHIVQSVDPDAAPSGVAVADDGVWLTDSLANEVRHIQPSGRDDVVPVAGGPTAVAVGAGAVWVVESLADRLVRIDPGTRRVAASVQVGHAPTGVVVGRGAVWVANSQDGTVSRIDPRSNHVTRTIEVGGSPQSLSIANGDVWVTVQPTPSGSSAAPGTGGTLRLSAVSDGFAEGYSPALIQIRYATCAKLVNYPDAPGPGGARLVPEVAESVPTATAGGRTYAFRIRRGFRFSPPSNEAVTARTFKYSLERDMREDPSLLTDVVGARAFSSGNARHVAGITAERNALVVRLVHRDPALPATLATDYPGCAVPIGTPATAGPLSIPSAGPYYVVSATPGSVVLARNPNYTGPRPHRLDRIELTLGVSQARSASDVESGGTDYAATGVPRRDAAALASRYGLGSEAARRGAQQYFADRALGLDFLALNTRRGIFRDVALRRAVNYAVDRRALSRLGSPFTQRGSTPTDQYLPPGMPGFRDVHVYPLRPDLATARRLAGGKRRTAVLYTCNDANCIRIGQEVKRDLAGIGIRVRIRTFTAVELFQRYATDPRYDLALVGYSADDADPADFLNRLLEGPLLPKLAVPRYRRELDTAAALAGPRRFLAYAKLDADLAQDAAPWIAFGNWVDHDFFSARTGCQVYNPVYGVDLAALCVRKG